MVTALGWFYVVAGTALFFFWAYGFVSFALDVRNVYVPAIRGWWATEEETEAERDPAEDPNPGEQLY